MSGRRAHFTWIPALLLAGAVSPYALAQVNWGGIRGTVTDQTGSRIPGAFVTANSDTLPRGLSTTTDERGWYAFPALPVGRYAITVVAPGFHALRYQNLNVKI